MAGIWASVMKPPPAPPDILLRPSSIPTPGVSTQSAPSGLSAGGNVRVYIDGNQLRATVRRDVSSGAARAALAGTTRGRP